LYADEHSAIIEGVMAGVAVRRFWRASFVSLETWFVRGSVAPDDHDL
jgi:hypothetical protein